MASLRKRNEFWYIRYRDETGKQTERKASRDKSVAKSMMKDLENRVTGIKLGTLDPRDSDAMEAERVPIADHVADYIRSLDVSPTHLENVTHRLGWFLEETKVSRLSQLRPSLAVTALKVLRDKGLSDQTVQHYAICWKSFSRWAWKDRRTRTDLLADLEPPKIVTTSKRSALSPEQAARLVASTRGGKVRCRMTGEDRAWLYTLAMVTGLRRGELQSLTPESFDLEGSPAVVSLPGRDTKNSDDAIQPLPSHVVPSLRSWLAGKSLFQKGGLERRKGMNPKPYPSDLTSQQWAVLKPFLPPARTGGRPRKTEMRSVVNAIFYRNRNGCIWRALPHDFPPWRTVYNYFAAWKRDGTWKAINDALRRRVRRRAGRPPTPTPAVSIARPSRRPKGVASMVTTVPSGSPVGSIISPWIPWGCF